MLQYIVWNSYIQHRNLPRYSRVHRWFCFISETPDNRPNGCASFARAVGCDFGGGGGECGVA